ncbi:hypothetical protein V6N11_012734 [Hibiscus sabdariffa]|uniref:Uncharacterized protein n=2 Tax=Hibiscus sabdariffa TaxID=183260 RepID=A0ABR2A474_9ROSI
MDVLSVEAADRFFAMPFDVWLQDNLHGSSGGMTSNEDWSMRFSICCWLLWKQRCSMIFDTDYIDRESVLDRGSRLILECETVLVSSRLTPNHVSRDEEHWEGPAQGRSQSIKGVVYVMPPSTVAMCIEEEEHWWEERSRANASTSQCSRRLDPGG